MELPLRLFTVEVLRAGELELVTAIEILSPVNKQRRHEARAEYLRKRRELLRSAAHLIEIDLLRAGLRPPLDAPVPPAPYYITLSREERRPCVDVWPIQLADTLPTIPVPLAEPDPDVLLDLSAAVAAVYRARRLRHADRLFAAPAPASPLRSGVRMAGRAVAGTEGEG